MDNSHYELPAWEGSNGDGVMKSIDEWAKKYATVLFFTSLILVLYVIWSWASKPVSEGFGALTANALHDMQAQQVNGWEKFTTKGIEAFSLPKKLFKINEHADAAPAPQASAFSQLNPDTNPINIGSSAYQVLSDVNMNCANRNMTNPDSWAWMNSVAQSTDNTSGASPSVATEGMKNSRATDHGLYLAAQGY